MTIRNRVCARRPDGDPGVSGPSIGLLNQPGWQDGPIFWLTQNAVCQQCGEMLGTSRPRYGPNRWPATVEACKCEDCGATCCDKCAALYRTSEIVGIGYRRTEGGARIPVATHRLVPVCPSCSATRKANAKPTESATTKFLREQGLLP